MFVAAASIEGLQAGLDVHLGDGLALTPKWAQQLHQAGSALHLAGAAFNKQLQSPQHEVGAGQITEPPQHDFALTREGQGGFLIGKVNGEARPFQSGDEVQLHLI